MHLIWLSLVIPPMFLVAWTTQAAREPYIWSLCLGILLLVLVVMVGVDVAQFLATSNNSASAGDSVIYRGSMRAIFAVITMTSVPLIAGVIGSCINWAFSRRSRSTKKTEKARSELGSELENGSGIVV